MEDGTFLWQPHVSQRSRSSRNRKRKAILRLDNLWNANYFPCTIPMPEISVWIVPNLFQFNLGCQVRWPKKDEKAIAGGQSAQCLAVGKRAKGEESFSTQSWERRPWAATEAADGEWRNVIFEAPELIKPVSCGFGCWIGCILVACSGLQFGDWEGRKCFAVWQSFGRTNWFYRSRACSGWYERQRLIVYLYSEGKYRRIRSE